MPALGLPAGPSPSRTLYVREREMMLACLERERLVAPLALRFVVGLTRGHLARRQRIMLLAWALALLVPSPRLRERCIRMKRSSVNRSRLVRAVLTLLMGRPVRMPG